MSNAAMNRKARIENTVETRSRILQSAKKEFAERGYDGARMGSIAKRARANQALIHYYFGNKENLYREVLDRIFGIGTFKERGFDSLIAEWGLSPRESLYVVIYFFVHFHFDASDNDFNKIIIREIVEERATLKAILREYVIPWHEAIERIIVRGIEAGEFETANPVLMVYNVFNFIFSYINSRHCFEGTEWHHRLFSHSDVQQFLQFTLDYVFKALQVPGAKVRPVRLPPGIIASVDEIIRECKKLSIAEGAPGS